MEKQKQKLLNPLNRPILNRLMLSKSLLQKHQQKTHLRPQQTTAPKPKKTEAKVTAKAIQATATPLQTQQVKRIPLQVNRL